MTPLPDVPVPAFRVPLIPIPTYPHPAPRVPTVLLPSYPSPRPHPIPGFDLTVPALSFALARPASEAQGLPLAVRD